MATAGATVSFDRYTLNDYETTFADRHLLHGNIEKWAKETPDALAIVEVETGREISYEYFDRVATALAIKLIDLGFQKGDFFASSLPLIAQHVFLEYACFKVGVIFAPLDLRLKGPEVIRSLSLIKAKGFAFLGPTPVADFRELGKLVQQEAPYVEHLLQFSPPEETIAGATSVYSLVGELMPWLADPTSAPRYRDYRARHEAIQETDGALVIYTTGSTGYPKPALLCHRGITCQNMAVLGAFRLDRYRKALINVPPSHVACQAAQMMGCFFHGSTAYMMRIFDPKGTLDAIEKYQIESVGQIPAMFAMEWRVPEFADHDHSSIEFLCYGGQGASVPMIERMKEMCPQVATGLGLTEMSGFVTYTTPGAPTEEIADSVGWPAPVTPLSIRMPMNEDGSAGEELSAGTIGDICFRGPQVFLGYVNDPAATAKTISKEGILYTGDLGYVDDRGLHYTGRSKLVIKPKGYQVFPGQVEEHFSLLREKVSACAAVGAPHDVFTEGIVLFVEKHPGIEILIADLDQHAMGVAAYMRPCHFEILDSGTLPLNRVAKTDYVTLKQRAMELIVELRQKGRWDCS
ncbi:acyl--CoA ligase [bacterium]|nr:acyl--CoA ligase [bacterium]